MSKQTALVCLRITQHCALFSPLCSLHKRQYGESHKTCLVPQYLQHDIHSHICVLPQKDFKCFLCSRDRTQCNKTRARPKSDRIYWEPLLRSIWGGAHAYLLGPGGFASEYKGVWIRGGHCTPVSCCGSALYLISLWERHTLRPYLYPHSQSLQFLASLELEQGLLEQQRERGRERGLWWAQSGTHLSGQSVSVPDNGKLA